MREFLCAFGLVLVIACGFVFFVVDRSGEAQSKPPVVKIGEACVASSLSMTIGLDGHTYRISTVELCGTKIVLRGRIVR
jgi:hypothetical protein